MGDHGFMPESMVVSSFLGYKHWNFGNNFYFASVWKVNSFAAKIEVEKGKKRKWGG
jgi:hypothetical protein